MGWSRSHGDAYQQHANVVPTRCGRLVLAPEALRGELVLDHDAVANPHLADAPGRHVVGVSRHAHAIENTIAHVSAPGIFRPPAAINEPIKSYAPGSPERAELQRRLA